MKKLMLLGAAVALAASALPGAAAAGRFSGVVVAKDTARHTLAVVSGSQVRTVRTAKVAAAVAVGFRVDVTGARLSDGTFRGQAVRRLGRAKQVRFSAVVVRHDAAKQQLIVSAGGTVFGLHFTGTTFAADNTGLAAGDEITVSAGVGKDGLDAGASDVQETGHVGQMKIVGIFLRGGLDGFDVAIVHRGLVRVHFTAGTQLPAWQPGDVIVLLVTVNPDGSFTLVQGHTDDATPGDGNPSGDGKSGDSGKTQTPTFVDARGALTGRTSTQVTVTREDATTLTCTVPTSIDVSSLAVGANVVMYCKQTDGGLILQGIKSTEPPPPAPGDTPTQTSFAGTLTGVSDSVSVTGDDGKVGTCAVPHGVDLSMFHVGSTVKLACVLSNGALVMTQLRSDAAWINLATAEVGLIGGLAEASSTGVTVTGDGVSLHCAVATPVDFSLFSVGDKVALSCKRTDAGLTFALLYGSAAMVKADGTIQRTVAGTLTASSGGTVTVQLENGSSVSCTAPATTDLSAFHTGDQVKMRCNLVSGQWRLSLLASATATVEVH